MRRRMRARRDRAQAYQAEFVAKEDAIQGLNKEVELLQNALQQEARFSLRSSFGVDYDTWQQFRCCTALLVMQRHCRPLMPAS